MRAAALAAALAALSVAAWLALDRLDGRAAWLVVDAPAHAIEGEPFPVRITITDARTPTWLVVDLHWSDRNGVARRFLSSGGRQQIGEAPASHSFAPQVVPREGLRSITVVAYTSPSGRWRDHDRAAVTRPIEVKAEGFTPATAPLLRLRAFSAGEPPAADGSSAAGRWAVAALLLAAALLSARTAAAGPALRERLLWAAVAAAAAAAAAWELLAAGPHATRMLRAAAVEGDWYHLRTPLQKALVAAVPAAGVGLALLALRLAGAVGAGARVALAAFIFYAIVSAVDLMSLHAVDALARRAVGPLSLVQALQAGAAAVVAASAALRRLARCADTEK